jgi:hypothetical protein
MSLNFICQETNITFHATIIFLYCNDMFLWNPYFHSAEHHVGNTDVEDQVGVALSMMQTEQERKAVPRMK